MKHPWKRAQRGAPAQAPGIPAHPARGARGRRLAMPTLAIALLAAVPSLDAEQFDNAALRERHATLIDTHNTAAVLGLASSGPLSAATELTELAANLALKMEPPVLEVPSGRAVYPDLRSDGSYACTFGYDLPQQAGVYEDLYGFGAIRRLPTGWGPFGTPRVEHRHSAVALSLAGVVAGQGALPEGDHLLTWIAETQLSRFWDVEFPAFYAGLGIASEAKNGKILARTGGRFSEAGARRARALKERLVEVAKDLGERASIDGAAFLTDDSPGFLGDEEPSARHTRPQSFRVWDVHPPRFRDPESRQVIENQFVSLEASDFGGARFRRVEDRLKRQFEWYDACGRSLTLRAVDPPSLIPIGGSGVDIEWILEDPGHYNHDDLRFELAANQELFGETSLRTRLLQRVVVADTQPPLLRVPDSFAEYAEEDLRLDGNPAALGTVRVVDLADPNPAWTSDAPEVLAAPTAEEGGRRYRIRYEAEDASGNRTVAPADDPDRYTQIVTLKAPGTNTAPSACDAAMPCDARVATVSDQPVSILLTGTDTDLVDDMVDPLTFTIADPPAHGQFVAPLFPYFIEDFRAKPVETPRDRDPATLACPAGEDLGDGRVLESRLGLLAIDEHFDYVTRCYCAEGIAPPTDFVNQPDYVHIADDGLRYVADDPFVCAGPSASVAEARTVPRISTWLDGELRNELYPQFDNSNNSRIFDVDEAGRVWVLQLGTSPGTSARVSVNTWDRDLAPWYSPDGRSEPVQTALEVTIASNPFRTIDAASLVSVHADVDREVLYVSDKGTVMVFSLFGPRERPALADLVEATDFAGLNVGTTDEGNCNTIAGLGSRVGFTMHTDRAGQLFVADSCAHKIHKFEPSIVAPGGELSVGDYVGWMGKCVANATDPDTGVEFNDCVVADQHSNGFQCSDRTCIEDPVPRGRAGSGPGQFDIVSHLNVDPNDVLYVADFRNRRIQRFGADGVFAGEAKSVGDGVTSDGSFVLGNMGPPSHVSVNGESFNVLEARDEVGDYFLHVFGTLPFYDVTPASARVDYVSDVGFRGGDRFTYFVDDGIDRSALATVTVDVGATQRPPENLRAECFSDGTLQTRTPCSLQEDGSIFLRLSSSDPDGFVGFGGYDTHRFRILEGPEHGALELQTTNANNAVYRYAPEEHFNGTDAFTFQASDGADEAATPGTVDLVVLPVEDRVAIEVPRTLRIPRGFERFYEFPFDDPDRDPDALLEAHSIDWGDGVFAGASGGWVNIGIRDDDGNPIDPQRDTLPGRGVLIGAHTYVDPTIGFSVCMRDNDALVCEDLQGESELELVDVTQVTVARDDDEDLQPETDTVIRVRVTNDEPQGWAGFAARATGLRIEPPGEVDVLSVPPECTLDAVIDCALGDLSVGETRTLDLVIRVALATARAQPVFVFRTEQTDAGPRLESVSHASFQVEVSDRDGDGTIDADDVFPDDDRYARDDDGDGLPDEWERRFGLDPTVDDTGLDPDGDGFDHRAEFEGDGRPLLADAYLASDRLTSGEPSLQRSDRFGFALGAGDFDGDGFVDVAIGAPSYDDRGAVFVYHGKDPVADESLRRLDAAGQRDFGRSLAVGDLNGDGVSDLAVGSADAVSVYLSTATGLPETPDVTIAGPPGDDLGRTVAIDDLDGDGIGDLLYVSPDFTGTTLRQGRVSIHSSRSAWWTEAVPTPSATLLGPENPNFRFGTSLAVGDVDGDGRADLLVGTETGIGFVYGYFGAGRSWAGVLDPAQDFTLSGQAQGDRFGHSVATGSDVDGDGIDDVLVGAYRNEGAGAAYLYGSRDTYWSAAQPPVARKLSGTLAGDRYGFRVALAEPGIGKTGADLVIGASGASSVGAVDEGLVEVFDGGPSRGPRVLVVPGTAHDMFGFQVLGAGDVDGDGTTDLVVGAPDPDQDGYEGDGGYVRVLFGGRSEPQPDGDADDVADALDNCPDDPNTNQADGDGDGAGSACDAFPEDARFVADTDGDGMPDRYEQENGLDPEDPADGAADLDGDGRSNRDEFLTGSDVANDDVPPRLTPPADRIVAATGPRTPVDPGAATADDARDGPLEATVDRSGPFAAGRHLLTWTATDAAGNVTRAVQRIDVLPMVDFVGRGRQVPEGGVVGIELESSGEAPEYPLTVRISATGTATAGSDYVLGETTLEIGPERRAVIALEVFEDGVPEGTETLELRLEELTNGTPGGTASHRIELVEGNVLPTLSMRIRQGGSPTTTAISGDGPVEAELVVDDPNVGDRQLIDWSRSDNALVPAEGFNARTFTFEPGGLVPGLYRLRANVVDTGAPTTVLPVERWLRIADASPPLSDEDDQDGDGIGDATEGAADLDLDGVPDHLDATAAPRELTRRGGETAALQTDAGLVLRLGSTAFASGFDADVTLADVAAHGSEGGAALRAEDDGYAYPSGLVDFEVHGLERPGASARVVVPLPAPVPGGARYRKYQHESGWADFVEEADDVLATAPGEPGVCPAPGHESYRPGLAAGAHCLQLTITDGGPNDADERADRVVRDPGGVAVPNGTATIHATVLPVDDARIRAGDRNVPLLRFRLTSASAGARLGAITLAASGTGDDARDVTGVTLWLDADGDGALSAADSPIGSGRYARDDGTLRLEPATTFEIPTGNSDYLVGYDF